MNRNQQVANMNLAEDLAAAGLKFAPSELMNMANNDYQSSMAIAGLGVRHREQRLGALTEQTEPGSSAQDPIDGPYVTRALMTRILDLPLGRLSEDDFDALIEQFGAKQVPEGDDDLGNLAEAVMHELHEAKRVARRMQAGKVTRTKKQTAKSRLRGKKYRRKPQAAKAKRKRDTKMAAGKIGQGMIKTARRQGSGKGDIVQQAKNRKKNRGGGARRNESQLATELQSLLDESSTVVTPFAAVSERIDRIFALIAEMVDDDGTSEVLEQAWTAFSESLTEDQDEGEFMEACVPCLKLIKHCLAEMDLADDDDDDDDDGDEGPN